MAHSHRSQARLEEWLTTYAGGRFSTETARYAASNVEVDWNTQAVVIANNYISILGLSPEEAVRQMSSKYGDRIPDDLAEKAVKAAIAPSL